MESGLAPARPPDVAALLTVYEVQDEATRVGVEQLCLDIWDKGWWDSYQSVQDAQAIDRAWLESKTSSIRSFECHRIPALLQTAEYARAGIAAASPLAPESDVTYAVEFTLRRQDRILDNHPPQVSVVLDESALHREVGSRAVLREQLILLLNLSTIPHIDLRVLPFSTGTPDLPGPSFSVLTMPPPFPFAQVALDTPTGPVHVGGPACRKLADAHDRLAAIAANPDESRALIQARADQLQ